MNFRYKGLGVFFLASDNFNATIFTRDLYIVKKISDLKKIN